MARQYRRAYYFFRHPLPILQRGFYRPRRVPLMDALTREI